MTKSMDLPRWSLEDRCLQPGSVLYSLGWKNTSIVQVVPTDFLSKMGIFGDTSFSWKTYHWSIEIYIYKWVSTKDADISPPYSSGFPICSSMTGATLGEPSLRRYLLLDRWEQWTYPLLLAASWIHLSTDSTTLSIGRYLTRRDWPLGMTRDGKKTQETLESRAKSERFCWGDSPLPGHVVPWGHPFTAQQWLVLIHLLKSS